MGHAPFQYPTPDGYPDVASPWDWGPCSGDGILRSPWLEMRSAKNIKVEEKILIEKAGGVDGLAASLLGRNPSVEEQVAIERSGEPLALLMASPGFQWR